MDGPPGPAGAGTRMRPPRPRPEPLRSRLVRTAGLLVLAVAVSVAGIAIASRLRPAPTLLAVGSRAPAIAPVSGGLPGRDAVAAAAGHPLLVEFFESTCPVCQGTGPALCDLLARHPTVTVVGVDAALEGQDAIAGYGRDHLGACARDPRLSLLADPCPQGSGCDNVTRRWRVSVVPTIYVVDGSGHIAFAGTGSSAVDGAAAAIDGALR